MGKSQPKGERKVSAFAIIPNKNGSILTAEKVGGRITAGLIVPLGGGLDKQDYDGVDKSLKPACRELVAAANGAIREACEEGGVKIEIDPVKDLIQVFEFVCEHGVHRKQYYFKAVIVGGRKKPNSEVKSLKFRSRSALKRIEGEMSEPFRDALVTAGILKCATAVPKFPIGASRPKCFGEVVHLAFGTAVAA